MRLKHWKNNRKKHHLRALQKALAEEITMRVHSKDLEQAIKSSEILFGKATKENLQQLDTAQIQDIF